MDKLITKIADYIVGKSSSWSRAFVTGKNLNDVLYGDSVGDAYSQVASVYKAVKAIADNVPQAPLRVYRKSDDELDDTSAKAVQIKALFDKPNALMTGSDFLQFVVGFYTLCGEAFIIKDFAPDAEVTVGKLKGLDLPSELWTFHPNRFQEKVEDGFVTGWKYNGHTEYPMEQVVLLKDFNPSNYMRGLAPTSPIKKQIDIDYKSLIYNSAFFDNFAKLGMTLTTDGNLTDAQWKRMTAYVDKQHKGASRSFKSAIFEGGLKPTVLGETHKDMEFIEQSKYTREEILGIWRVPKALFNITDDLNYATFMGQMRIFWLYGIMPVLRKVEESFNARIVQPFAPDLYVKFDLMNVPAFQADLMEKVDVASKLFSMGVPMNKINERLALGFDDIPNGDVSWLPMNLIPAGSQAMETEPEAEPEKPKDDDDDVPAEGGKIYVSSAVERNKTLQMRTWKGFINYHDASEKKIKSRASKYLWEQRDRVIRHVVGKGLNGLNGLTKEVIHFDIDWKSEKEFLKRDFDPVIYDAVRRGADFAREMSHREIEQAILEGKLRSFTTVQIEKLTRVDDWLKSRIELNIEQGLSEGLTNDQIGRNLKQFYNDVKPYWTQRIARTEATSALNGGSYTYLDEAGAKTKTWISAIDESTRQTHLHQNGMTIKFTDRFPNGLMYPADDGDPAEVCNCRCTLVSQDL